MAVALALVLLVTGGFNVPLGAQGQAGAGQSSMPWWNLSYPFRTQISVSNRYYQTLVDAPALVRVTFPVSHLVDAESGLTLVADNGTAVPSYVVDSNQSGGFVTSVWLMTFVTLPPLSTHEYWLYYGNPSAQTPLSRIGVIGSSFSSGLLSVTQQSSGPSSQYFQYTYAQTFSDSVYSRLSYSLGGERQFGSLRISPSPLTVLSPWRAIANVSRVPLFATAVTSTAPNLRVTQLDVLSGDTVLSEYLIENSGTQALGSLNFTSVLDTSALAALAPASTSFAGADGLVTTQVEEAVVGFRGVTLPAQHGVGPVDQVLNQTLYGVYNSQDYVFGPAGAALSWNLGGLGPGQVARFFEAWSVSSSVPLLGDALQGAFRVPRATSVGGEEIANSLLPSANMYWSSTLSKSDTPILKGLSFPLTIHGGTWLQGTAMFSGSVSYTTPAPDFNPSRARIWSTASSAVGNATASSSASYWSVQDSTYVGRTAVTTSVSNATAAASLASSGQTLVGASSYNLTLRYEATLAGTGNASAQSFFFEVDVDHSLTGTYDQALLLPVFGTGSTSCPSGALGVTSHPAVQVAANLVADGTWRTATINLGPATSLLGLGFRLRFCEAIRPGFVGGMEMRVSSVGVNVSAPAQGLVVPSIDPTVPLASVQPLPEITGFPTGARISGNLTFMVFEPVSLGQRTGSVFASQPVAAPTVKLNGTMAGAKLTSRALGVTIATPYQSLKPTVYLSGNPVPASPVGGDSLYASGGEVAQVWNNSGSAATVGVSFDGYQLAVDVVDVNNRPVAGANVSVTPATYPPVAGNVTGGSGVALLSLLPWNYSLEVSYQGTVVASGGVAISGSSAISFRASVIQTTLRVQDTNGSPLAGLQITATDTRSSSPLVGVTNASGEYSFQAPLGSVYHLVVTGAGTTYYDHDITVAANHGLITIPTSYYPSGSLEKIVLVIVALAITATLVVLVLRMRRASRSRD